jgi:HEAT repeat protein
MEELYRLVEDLQSGDDTRAHAAIRKISAYGPRVLPLLERLLTSPVGDIRWWATWAVSEVRDPKAPELLRTMLKDPDDAVRECAALALRQQPSKQAVPDLIDCLKSEDQTLAHLAAAALVAAGPEAVKPLIEVLNDGPIQARLQAVRALAQIGDVQSIPALFEALNKDSALLEYWASEGLDRMGVGQTFFKT